MAISSSQSWWLLSCMHVSMYSSNDTRNPCHEDQCVWNEAAGDDGNLAIQRKMWVGRSPQQPGQDRCSKELKNVEQMI